MFDTYSSASGAAAALTRGGDKTWYFLTVDYAFGHSLEKDASDVVKAYGGQVLGNVRHPLNASDFSSFILQAKNSGAQVIGLANGAQDTVNAIKAAREFGVGGKQKVASLLMFLTDVHPGPAPGTRPDVLGRLLLGHGRPNARAVHTL